MPLTFRQESTINRKLLDLYQLRLVDKEKPVIEWPGKRYYLNEPSQSSFVGSIGHMRNPDFAGPQAPNSMGMVILASPGKKDQITLSVSGRFDVTHRVIPEYDEMKKNLKMDGDTPKVTQAIYGSFKRFTITFEKVELSISLPKQLNEWVTPIGSNSLSQSLRVLEEQCIQDPEIFKECHATSSGPKIQIDWDDKLIKGQSELTQLINQITFSNTKEVMPYSVQLRARARTVPASMSEVDGAVLVELFLENLTTRDTARDFGIVRGAFLLDVQFSTELAKGQGHKLPHKLSPKEYRHLIHSKVPGYGISTSVSRDNHGIYHTNAMPISALPRTANPDVKSLGMGSEPSFEILSYDPLPVLKSLVDAVRDYADEWIEDISRLRSEGKTHEAEAAEQDHELLLQEAININDGVNLLDQEPELLLSFMWMNEVMAQSFKQQDKNIHTWRLFQLGFILTQIRAIYERSCDEPQLTDHIDTAEVLWFATGGGKTEAYFGIVIMSMLYERIGGRLYGVTAWMKFPLRMLSVQQFQRLAYVIAYANRIREREELKGFPFTIGYFTGEGTPSFITNSLEFYDKFYLPKLSHKQLQQWKFVSDCPYCDAVESVSVERDLKHGRIYHYCNNPECWSNTEASEGEHGEGLRGELGIFVSDEEVYRYQPTVLVGTIDKLAVIAHNKNFRVLFGNATHYCPDHGFILEGKCSHKIMVQQSDGSYRSEACPNNSRTSSKKTIPLKSTDQSGIQFILQDELHLLSENTGNFAAHYETLMSLLQVANGGRPPKILSATATIKGYSDHIHHLYLRKARRFPVPGIKHGESFYSRLAYDEEGELIQRWYAGILPLGAGAIVERTSSIASMRFLTLVDDIVSGLESDPEHFTPQLGMSSSEAKEIKDYISTYLNTCLIYNNNIKGNTELQRSFENYQVPTYPERRWIKLDGTTPLDEIQKAITLVETKPYEDPTRQLIATSVVSHGVDMSRLNFMIIAGWPKSIAEYMQSSARSGRVNPGIVLSVYSYKSLYETNVFLNFEDYHRFLDRLVESVPINRLAPNVIDRTIPGVFSACILNWLAKQPFAKDLNNAGKIKEVLADSSNRAYASLQKHMLQALSVPDHLNGAFDPRMVNDFDSSLKRLSSKLLNIFADLPSNYAKDRMNEAIERIHGKGPMRNFRDIETLIDILPNGDTSDLMDALGGNQ